MAGPYADRRRSRQLDKEVLEPSEETFDPRRVQTRASEELLDGHVMIMASLPRGDSILKAPDDQSGAERRGRPRDPLADDAILKATLLCLGRDGYSRMTVDGIAREAGVTRPTIYRRWPSKAELTIAAISDLMSKDKLTMSGDARAELVGIVRAVYRALIEQGRMQLLGSIFAEDHHNPDFVSLFRNHVIEPRRGQFHDALSSGIASGQVREDVDIPIVTDFLIGSFLSRWLSGMPVPADWPEQTVDLIWPVISAESVLGSRPERNSERKRKR